jgi:glycosyltransferase involved in cell wall biosynthesis
MDRITGLRWQLHSVAGLRHRSAAASRALAECVAQQKLDIVETTSSGLFASQYLRRKDRVPVVTRVSTTAAQLVAHNAGRTQWPERVEQRWEEQLVRASDGIVTHTVHHRDEVCRTWQLRPEAFAIIPHGIRLPPRHALPTHIAHDAVEVLFVGRFEHRKGIDILFEVIPRLLAADRHVRFTLVGQDAGNHWETKFRKNNPDIDPRRVTFAGIVSSDQLREHYRACDLFVAPSRYESFGLIYVEAMAWGKPVVGCRAGGVPEVIANESTGLLAEPGDAASLLACLRRLITDPAQRIKFGTAARERAESHFSHTMLAARSAEYYRKILRRAATLPHSTPACAR